MEPNTRIKELLFNTIRINSTGRGESWIGTGFLLHETIGPDTVVPFLVTNRHVVEGADSVTLDFMAASETGGQAPGKAAPQTISGPDLRWFGHPDVEIDVAVISLAKVIDQQRQQLFYRTLPTSLMHFPGDSGLFVDAIEEVFFIGYPNGHRDETNLTPIVRRGTTATPLELNFDGKSAFLLDGSVFGGSSGSPVYLIKSGTYRTSEDNVSIGSVRTLIGIVSSTIVRNSQLPVQSQIVTTPSVPFVSLQQELNLGIAFNCVAIRETIDAALGK